MPAVDLEAFRERLAGVRSALAGAADSEPAGWTGDHGAAGHRAGAGNRSIKEYLENEIVEGSLLPATRRPPGTCAAQIGRKQSKRCS